MVSRVQYLLARFRQIAARDFMRFDENNGVSHVTDASSLALVCRVPSCGADPIRVRYARLGYDWPRLTANLEQRRSWAHGTQI